SDYITRPYEFREVDMRERLLPIALQLESKDTSYEFKAALKIVYQVERPERIAIELEDALVELEQVLIQSVRATSRAFGVEQLKALEQHLLEALLYGDVLRGRLSALGLQLSRADVALELDNRARDRADVLRDQMRERPLAMRLSIDSLDSGMTFDAQIGGSYRLIGRWHVVAEEGETTLREAVQRTLSRIGIAYAVQDYESAERAMLDALRFDTLFQSELAAAEIELVRGTVKIQPSRDMVIAAQQAVPTVPFVPALPAPSQQTEPQGLSPLSAGFEPSEQLDNVLPWGTLGRMFDREPPTPANIQAEPALYEPPQTETPAHFQPFNTPEDLPHTIADTDAASDFSPFAGAQPEPTHSVTSPSWSELRPTIDQPADTSASGDAPVPDGSTPLADHQEAFEHLTQPFASAEQPVSQPSASVDLTHIARWISLLKADDPALFKLWSLEVKSKPETLPTILSALTDDPAVLRYVDDATYQHALVAALDQPTSVTPTAVTQSGTTSTSAAPATPAAADEPAPDWLRLRRAWKDDGGSS
ncbi:MAG TPA: hypothetical protein VFX76_12600, partial [Roseiflexaceae bacterium]|nr:hypothetical protein [Roseiflexaceae bacterium]